MAFQAAVEPVLIEPVLLEPVLLEPVLLERLLLKRVLLGTLAVWSATMVSVVYVARHGLRANQEPSPTGIDGDVRLTAEGEFQAEELARFVSSPALGDRIDAVYCSPFYRCLQTVTPTCTQLGNVPIWIEPGLGEYYHVLRPTHPVPLPAAASKQYFPLVDVSYAPQVSVPAAGETLESLHGRVSRAMDAVLAHADARGFRCILIMTHAAVKIKISEVLTGTTVRAGTCSLDKHERVGKRFVTTVDGLTTFLSGGEQMHWSFDMAYEAGSAADEASRADPKAAPALRSDPAAPKVPSASVPVAVPVGAGAGANAAGEPSSESAQVAAEEPMVKVLLPLDTSSLPPDAQPEAGALASSVEVDLLETDRPLAKIGDKLYEGQWSRILGTELYASPEGEPVGQASYRLQMLPVEVQPEDRQRAKLADRIKAVDQQKGKQ